MNALSSWSTVWPCASGQVCAAINASMSAARLSICACVQVAPPATASASIETDGELIGATTASPSVRASGSAFDDTKPVRASA